MDTDTLREAQAEVRRAYLGASVGQIYSGLAWLVSVGVWWLVSDLSGIVTLLVAGFLVYPVTTGVCRLLGRPGSIPSSNPLRTLGQTAPIVGAMGVPVALGATLHDQQWFFPAMMIVIGAHYLPFWPLYGMPVFVPLGIAMWAVGLVVAMWLPSWGLHAGALTGAALLAVGLLAWRLHRQEVHD